MDDEGGLVSSMMTVPQTTQLTHSTRTIDSFWGRQYAPVSSDGAGSASGLWARGGPKAAGRGPGGGGAVAAKPRSAWQHSGQGWTRNPRQRRIPRYHSHRIRRRHRSTPIGGGPGSMPQ